MLHFCQVMFMDSMKVNEYLDTEYCNTALARSWVVLLSLDAQPTDGEQETFEEVQRVLRNSEPILEEIQCYKGAGKEIREVSTLEVLLGC
jgi:hypothetical protein